MGADLHDDVEREERVARVLRRPVRDPLVFPFSGVEARLEHRASGPFVAFATIGLLVVALAIGSALARQRADVLAPSAMPTATPSSSPAGWQAQLMADARAAAPSTFWPLMPTYVADAVDAQVTTSASCGASSSPCLEYGFFRGASSDAEFRVLQGPAGCCLDAARPNATRDVEIRSGVSAQYDRVAAQFGGAFLWWVENTARGPVYVAISSPVLSEDELVRIANSTRPVPSDATSAAPTAPPSPDVVATRPFMQVTPAIAPVVVNAVRAAGAIGIVLGGNWTYDGQTGVLWYLPPARPPVAHPAPKGSVVAVERLAPAASGSHVLIAKELAIRDGSAERVIYRTRGDGFYWSGWSPDGKYVALWEIDQFSGSSDMDGRPLVIIDVQTGGRTDLATTLLWGTTAWTAPHTLAYIAGTGREPWDNKTLRLWSAERGSRDVTPSSVAAFGPAWSSDGRLLYFISGPSGQWDPLAAAAGKSVGDRRISVYDASVAAIRSVPNVPGYVAEGVRPSRDGAHLLVLGRQTADATDVRSIPRVDLEVWLTDANGANATALVRFPGYGLNAYGYLTGPSEWTWSE